MKINVGCGDDYKEGYVNIDNRNKKADIIHDIEKGLPFRANKADLIECTHVVEHIRDPIRFIDECWRVLSPGGLLHIFSPHTSQLESSGELDHKRSGLGVFSFHYTTGLSVKHRDYYGKARFRIMKVRIRTHPLLQKIADISPIKYEKYLSRFFSAREIEFVLMKVKK